MGYSFATGHDKLKLEHTKKGRDGIEPWDIEVLLECLKYSIQRVSEAQGTPYPVRQENLERLRAVQDKLRRMRDEGGC